MAFAGLRKQINKANQYVTEKMGGAEGTKLDLDFMDMERKTDVTVELVEELQTKTKEFLQPNPTARAKMAAVKGISKLSGQAKSNTYPQPEGVLGDCMLLYGKKLGEDSVFSQCLIEMGESLKQMADVKYSLDDNIKQSFLEPLHHLQTKDLKEVMHHRKKLQGRRLDFDCKRRRQAKDDEIRQAEEKFAESLQLAQVGMFNLLDNDVEQVAQLTFFAEGLLEYHQQCTEILKTLVSTLMEKKEEAANRPKMEFVPKTLSDLNIDHVDYNNGMRMAGSVINLSPHKSNLKPSRSVGNLSTKQTLSVPQNYDPLNMWDNPPPYFINTHDNFKVPASFRRDINTSQSFISGVRNNSNLLKLESQNNRMIPSNSYNSSSRICEGGSHAGSPEHKPPNNLDLFHGTAGSSSAQRSNNASPLPSPMKSPSRTPVAPVNKQPCCTALYDFDPENQGELGFKENEVITLISKVDENWYEGSIHGKSGYFPVSYVQVNVPLPNM